MARAYVAFGSNIGDRRAHIAGALEALRDISGISVSKVSDIAETTPVDCPPGSQDFLNGVIELETSLSAAELLEVLQSVEQGLGRVRAERNGPRTIDLDILLFGDEVLNGPELTVPHPRMHERPFVLDPLLQIAPELRDPRTGERYADIREALN